MVPTVSVSTRCTYTDLGSQVYFGIYNRSCTTFDIFWNRELCLMFNQSMVARDLRVKKGPNIYTADKSAKLFLWLGEVIVISFRRDARSYQLLVVAILDFFKMAAPENKRFYFLSYLLIHMWYFNDSGV